MVLTMILFSINVVAQGELEDEVVIIKAYKPILADAIKNDFNPYLPTAGSLKPEVSYDIPTKALKVTYEPTRIKALSMRKIKPEPIQRVYIKAGYGNFASPLLEVYFNSLRNKK
ncbi:MAG: hypothetical protein IIA45_09745, partial [Bacteroidetes bacterium]|nr:hypothetical protein [Bacteroidota bacterium]